MRADAIEDGYDRKAFEYLIAAQHKAQSAAGRTSRRASAAVGASLTKAAEALPEIVQDGGRQAFAAAFSGLQTLTLDPAMRSVSASRVVQSYRKAGFEVFDLGCCR